MHLVGFTIEIYYDAWPCEHQNWLKVVFPVHAVKAYMRSGGIVPLILNLYPFGGGYLNFHEGRSVRGSPRH